jgi:membrane-associated phospholipid phosphatase
MQIRLFIDYIGYYAPIILFFLSLLLLRNMKRYLQFFVSGFILNNILNIVLKLFIKESRPSNDQKIIEIAINNGARVGFDKFGMPSGHAQNCGYCLIFIMTSINNLFITTLYMAITLISLSQRYLYNNHTILQLLIGLLIGSGFGYLTYSLGNKFIMGNIKMKKDEEGPL